MKLSEILVEPLKSTALIKPKTDNLKLERDDFQGYKIYSEEFPKDNQMYLEIRTHADEFCGWNVFSIQKINGREYAIDQRTSVETKFQNKGIGTLFYYFIIQYLGYPLISDKGVSPAGKQLYLSLAKKFKASLVNAKTFEIEPYDKDKVFSKTSQPSDYRIIFEDIFGMKLRTSIISETLIYIRDGF